jgi:hypothetical protein
LALTRRMRATASFTCAIGSVPLIAARKVASNSPFQLLGALARSSPAVEVFAQSVMAQPGISPWPFQSPMTRL